MFAEQDSFELDLEDAIQPPPISISAPDLALLEYSTLHTFPMRRSVSSTELLYERAMARFYEAVELEEAEKARKLKISQDKLATPGNVRKRLGSMTEAERLSFEKRSEMRRQSADITHDLKAMHKWNSRENMSEFKSLSRAAPALRSKRQESQESEELSDDYRARSVPFRDDSYDLGTDYTESTASESDKDSIEKFKMELMARTHSPSPRELETYHPRSMSAGTFTPYRAPTPDEAALVLTRPMPLPSPDFVPKPILKRPSNESVVMSDNNGNTSPKTPDTNANDKMDLAKGIKSFFKRDKRSATEKNTEENELMSNPQESTNASLIKAEVETKRRAKEVEEEQKRKEAERVMMEEAHAAADHYSQLVQQVTTTKKYHTPIYMDQEELKKISAKVKQDDSPEGDGEGLKSRRSQSPEGGLMPPVSNKPRLSISERGQMMHVRETGSNLAMKQERHTPDPEPEPETPSESNEPVATPQPIEPTPPTTPPVEDTDIITTTVISETVEERPDSRGRPRLVKVKRILKKRMPSGTRSRDTSLSRPPSAMSSSHDQSTPTITTRTLSRTRRAATAESRSPGPFGRKPLATASKSLQDNEAVTPTAPAQELMEVATPPPTPPLSDEEAHEKVRSAISYSTDMVLFIVACYVYLFKDARLVLPILALMIYRQLGEAISRCIPSWLRRKKQ